MATTGTKVTFKRFDGTNWVELAPTTDWANINNKPSTYTPSSHTHGKADITDFPTSLPANGGNADTVDNKHASDFASASHTHSQYLTSHQSLANYYTKTQVDSAISTAITTTLNTSV